MKKYYVYYYSNFCNTYDILSVEDAEDQEALDELKAQISGDLNKSVERITLKEIRSLAKAERYRYKFERNFSYGYCNPKPAAAKVLKKESY